MNNARRKAIEAVVSILEDAKATAEELQSEEQDYFDNMPESFQDAERGEQAQAAIDAFDTALSDLDSAIYSLQEATQ